MIRGANNFELALKLVKDSGGENKGCGCNHGDMLRSARGEKIKPRRYQVEGMC